MPFARREKNVAATRADRSGDGSERLPCRISLSATRRQLLIGGLTIAAAGCLAPPVQAAQLIVTSVQDYRSGLARLSSQYPAALIDISAEWCAFCKTIDRKILPDPDVRRAMARVALIKVDVTNMDQSNRELLRSLRAEGPPTLFVVQTASGREFAGTRSVGAFSASDLVRRLKPFA